MLHDAVNRFHASGPSIISEAGVAILVRGPIASLAYNAFPKTSIHSPSPKTTPRADFDPLHLVGDE